MYQAFLIKYGEIAIKGKNRYQFEDALVSQIARALKKVEGRFLVRKEQGRIFAEALSDYDYDEALKAMKNVFGIIGICPVVVLDDMGVEELSEEVISFVREQYGEDCAESFKVHARRARKSYPVQSMDIDAKVGEKVLGAFPKMHVDVHNPKITIYIEVRDRIYVYSEVIPGLGGMPLGTNGRSMLLLSGGIDSPVAGYLIAKRGVSIDAVYFHAPPYTSERAKQKVLDLAAEVSRFTGPINLYVVNFTEIQLYIYEKCPHDELTIIMRRYMMRIAEEFAKKTGCLGLITGESIGQVASQTVQSLAATNEVCTMPVFRPLIAYDKEEIIRVAKQIGTYETSILPYEDCCTIFVAKHPVTKPAVDRIKKSELNLTEKIDEMVERAVETAELVVIE